MIQKTQKIKWIKFLLIIELLLVGGIWGYSFNSKEINHIGLEQPPTKQTLPITKKKPSEVKTFADYQALNKDYIAQLSIEGLIDLPVVQSQLGDINAAYDQYLRTAFDTMEHDEEGSIFMDPNNELSDQNLVIYGHNVAKHLDLSMSHKFTPLHKLKDIKNYAKYQNIQLELKDETRKYQVAHVYYAKILKDEMGHQSVEPGSEYLLPRYSASQLETYLEYVSGSEFYDTGVEITSQDRFLTLQTCVDHHDDLRLIIIAKEIGEENHES